MTRGFGVTATVLIVLNGALGHPALAQGRGQAAPATPAEQAAPDPLGRDTPRGTITGFNAAVHREDFVSAAAYLQLTGAQRPNAESLARQLTDLTDRYYKEPVAALSGDAGGTTGDGLALDRERIALAIPGKPFDVGLVRVKDPGGAQIWLVSSQTLARVPEVGQSLQLTRFERLLPSALVDLGIFGVPIARWIVWAGTLAVPFAGLWLVSTAFISVARRTIRQPTRRSLVDTWYAALRSLLVVVLALGLHLALMPLLGFSLTFRIMYTRIVLAVVVVAATWLLWRFMTLAFADASVAAVHRGRADVRSLLHLAEGVCKSVVFLLAIFALLTIAGVNTSTALAGVGIGGIAIALGAQKSVENLLGGVFLITDRALAVGDTCSISNRVGVVEDITMRSVRLRTTEQTLLSVPAGMLSQSSLENYATREKIPVQTLLRLRYGTTSRQLQRLLTDIRARLEEEPDLETSSARARLVNFGVTAIEIEVFAYVLTADYQRFLAVREELLLDIATLVEAAGTGFAQPVVTRDPAAVG